MELVAYRPLFCSHFLLRLRPVSTCSASDVWWSAWEWGRVAPPYRQLERVAVSAYDIPDVIVSSYISQYAIHSVFTRALATFSCSICLSHNCVPLVSPFLMSVLVLQSSVAVSLAFVANLARSTGTIFRIPSSSIVMVVGVTSTTRIGPILGG